MNKSTAYYISVKDSDAFQQVNVKLGRLLAKVKPFDSFKDGSLVAIKLHFGEEGNAGFVSPKHIGTLVNALYKKGGKAFLTDTNALYKGKRTNATEHLRLAYEHGFIPENVAAPVIIADGLKGDEYREVKLQRGALKIAYVASAIHKADALVVVSHFKGHIMTGFGGALKNLGMGCAARRGKLVQHGGVAPIVVQEKCIACQRCVEVCPVSAIAMVTEKAKIDPKICIGCASCIAVCPVAAIDLEWLKGAEVISKRVAEYASAAVDGKKETCVYINFATKITKECDCLAKDDPKICPDIGIFMSTDPVAIDQACVDAVNKVSGKDLFREQHPGPDWQIQLSHAQEMGLGSCDYELIEVN
ncbi:DUF362 domain-containing protein [Candidatus Omnitrophota bacterium]